MNLNLVYTNFGIEACLLREGSTCVNFTPKYKATELKITWRKVFF